MSYVHFFSVTSDSIDAKWPNIQNEFEELFPGGIDNDSFTCKNIRYVTRLLTFEKHLTSGISKLHRYPGR